MGAGDLTQFREAGRTLFSLGLVKGSEGNLSTWDGSLLRITRAGCELFRLAEPDVVEGTLDLRPAGASSDFERHVEMYRAAGPGAIAHAHPVGSMPPGWIEGQQHGRYEHAETLRAAVDAIVRTVREAAT